MVYINPQLISIYKEEYLEEALKNPRLPKSLRLRIEYELYKRKSSNIYNKTTNTNNSYYKLYELDGYYLCLGVAEFYVSATPECYDF